MEAAVDKVPLLKARWTHSVLDGTVVRLRPLLPPSVCRPCSPDRIHSVSLERWPMSLSLLNTQVSSVRAAVLQNTMALHPCCLARRHLCHHPSRTLCVRP